MSLPYWIRCLFIEDATDEQTETAIMLAFNRLPPEIKERIAIRCIDACKGLDTRKPLRRVK
jgi:hypothetical protein